MLSDASGFIGSRSAAADTAIARQCAVAKPGQSPSNDPALLNAIDLIDNIANQQVAPAVQRIDPSCTAPA